MHLLTSCSQYFDKCSKRSIFVKIITRSDTVAMLDWLSCYKNDTDYWLQGCHLFKEKFLIRKTKLSFEVIVRWTKFSQFVNYLAKHCKIQIYKTVKLAVDVRAIRRITALNWGSCRSYLHCIKPL